jgi:hypothetical protein
MVKSLKTETVKSKEDVYRYLIAYLDDAIDMAARKQRDEDNFSLPAWAEFQAYQLGTIKAYQKVLDLIPKP